MGCCPADAADTPVRREDRDEVVAVRLAELGNRRHGRSGPHEFRCLRRLGYQPLQPVEDVVGVVRDGDAGALGVAAGPVVLQQAGHEEHMASVLQREPCLHARSALAGRLDDHCRERVPAHHRVAHRERRLRRRRAGQKLGDDQALGRDLLLQRGVLRRIRTVDARADDGHRTAARGECRRVRGGVDARREAADDRNAPGASPVARFLA